MTYKGYTIEGETEPWALKYGMNYAYYLDGERIRHAKTVEEAKDEIDEIIETMTYTPRQTKSKFLLDHEGNNLQVRSKDDKRGYDIVGYYHHKDEVVTDYDYQVLGGSHDEELLVEAERIVIERISLDLGKNTDFRCSRKQLTF